MSENEKTLIKGPRGEDIYKEDYTDEWGNVTKDGKVLAACGEWFEINPWKSEEIANAPMDQWFSLDEVWKLKGKPELIGKYWMNKNGWAKSITRKTKVQIWKPDEFFISGKRIGKLYYYFQDIPVSVLYAELFLKNDDPINKIIVDHINGNSLNNHHINLRWVTVQENSMNKEKVSIDDSKRYKIYFAKFSLDGVFIEWVQFKNTSRIGREIVKAIKEGKCGRAIYRGFIWEKYTNVAKDYVEKYGFPDPNEWVESIDFPEKVWANSNGCIYKKEGMFTITVGGIHAGYYSVKVGDRHFNLNRLVYCIQHNISLESIEGLDVDHYNYDSEEDNDSMDNRIKYLRLVTHSENMKNPKTIAKLSSLFKLNFPVKGINVLTNEIYEFNTLDLAEEQLGIPRKSIMISINNPNSSFKSIVWCRENEDPKERMKLYFDSIKIKPKGWYEIEENRIAAAKTCKNRREYNRNHFSGWKISNSIPGELDRLFPPGQVNKKWTLEKCIEEIQKYSTSREFHDKDRSAYEACKEYGLLPKYFPNYRGGKVNSIKNTYGKKKKR